MQKIQLDYLVHRGKEWISIRFESEEALKKKMHLLGAKWSRTHSCWLMPCIHKSFDQIRAAFKDKKQVDWCMLRAKLPDRKKNVLPDEVIKGGLVSKGAMLIPYPISTTNRFALRQFLETLHQRSYSKGTISTYRNEFLQLIQTMEPKPVKNISADELQQYLEKCTCEEGLKGSTIHSRINALKFYYEQVLHRQNYLDAIPRPRRSKMLPNFFTQHEIERIIDALDNLKHRTMLTLAYGAGLGVSDLINLKVENIDSAQMCIHLDNPGRKAKREVSISPLLLDLLRSYWRQYRPAREGYLFEGQVKGEPYSTRSLQLILKKAKLKSGIEKPGSMHALRNSADKHQPETEKDLKVSCTGFNLEKTQPFITGLVTVAQA